MLAPEWRALDLYLQRWKQYPPTCQRTLIEQFERDRRIHQAELDAVKAKHLSEAVDAEVATSRRFAWWEVTLIAGGAGAAGIVAGVVGGILIAR